MIQRPTDLRTAEQLLRNEDQGFDTKIVLDREKDILIIAVKSQKDEKSDDKITWRLWRELPLSNIEAWKARYVSAAQAAYDFWLTLQK